MNVLPYSTSPTSKLGVLSLDQFDKIIEAIDMTGIRDFIAIDKS
ncbi:MAG: hypothetical protein AAF349_23150 [Cyanobacteria bacterium P01_A01_bin.68]